MTWTYDVSEATERDQVRGRIGDTDTSNQLIANETIDSILTARGSVLGAAVECVQRIIAKLARSVDRSNVRGSASRSQAIQAFKDLLGELRTEAGLSNAGGAFTGGTSLSEAQALEDDSDYQQPKVKRDQDSIPDGWPSTGAEGDE